MCLSGNNELDLDAARTATYIYLYYIICIGAGLGIYSIYYVYRAPAYTNVCAIYSYRIREYEENGGGGCSAIARESN